MSQKKLTFAFFFDLFSSGAFGKPNGTYFATTANVWRDKYKVAR